MARKPKQRVFFSGLRGKFTKATAPVKRISKTTYSSVSKQIKLRPLSSFFALLIFLLGLIFISNQLTKPEEETQSKVPVKEVQTFNIGEAPRIRLSAQVEKSGVIQIVAQAPGIVSKVHVTEGKSVKRGTTLVSTGSNYLGANAASVQRQLAQVQYQNAKNTFSLQKEIIAKQREIADKTDASADELRDIANRALDETRSLIALNEEILSSVDRNLETLENTNVGGANDDLILQTQQVKAQLLAGLNQTRSGLRSAEFQASADEPPAQLSNLNRELVQKQLDLQEKSLSLGLETARLQVRLAQISESIMFPAAPFAGTIERVHVKVGQTVAPGTPLITLSGTVSASTVIALVPQNTAQNINKLQSSYLLIENERVEASPIYISKEATNGQLYSAIFAVPEGYESKLTDLGYIDIEVPIGTEFTSSAYPFVPLDSVQQTQDKAVVFVVEGETAAGKNVALGEVQGNYVQIVSGLSSNDKVIRNRNIISGDKVTVQNPQL